MADSVTEIRDNGPDLRDVLDQYDNDEENLVGPNSSFNLSSEYYDIEDIASAIPNDSDFNFKAIHINIHSLPDKFDN